MLTSTLCSFYQKGSSVTPMGEVQPAPCREFDVSIFFCLSEASFSPAYAASTVLDPKSPVGAHKAQSVVSWREKRRRKEKRQNGALPPTFRLPLSPPSPDPPTYPPRCGQAPQAVRPLDGCWTAAPLSAPYPWLWLTGDRSPRVRTGPSVRPAGK